MRKLNRNTKSKAAIAAVAVLAVGFGGIALTGAYFTDQATAPVPVTVGTVILGDITSDAATTLALVNILPTSDANVESIDPQQVHVRNEGTASIDWAATITASAATNPSNATIFNQLEVSYSTSGGSEWSVGQKLNQLTSIASPASVEPGTDFVVLVRLLLPADTDNTFQGATGDLIVSVNAIQADSPTDQFSSSAFTPVNRPANLAPPAPAPIAPIAPAPIAPIAP